jgi:hypothetical protein
MECRRYESDSSELGVLSCSHAYELELALAEVCSLTRQEEKVTDDKHCWGYPQLRLQLSGILLSLGYSKDTQGRKGQCRAEDSVG